MRTICERPYFLNAWYVGASDATTMPSTRPEIGATTNIPSVLPLALKASLSSVVTMATRTAIDQYINFCLLLILETWILLSLSLSCLIFDRLSSSITTIPINPTSEVLYCSILYMGSESSDSFQIHGSSSMKELCACVHSSSVI